VTSAVASAVLAYIPSPDRGVWYLGPVPIRAYALCIIAGIIIAVVWGERRFVARGGAAGTVTDVAVFAVPFGLVGGRLYHVATDWPTYFGPGGDPVKALEIWEGGLGIWGAIALGAVGAWIGCRRRGIPLPFFADAVAPGIVVAQAVGRLGNYFNQELYGAPTDLPWGLEIFRRVDPGTGLDDPLGGVAIDHTPVEIVQPTFLYELILNLVVAGIVVWADRRFKLGHGRAFAVYVAGYTLGRFFIEQMRTDQATRVFGDIRINVVVSVVVFIGAVIYIAVAPKGREQLAPPETTEDDAPVRVAPGPDLRKPTDRPSGGAVAVAEPATEVEDAVGGEQATTVLEAEQPTTYLEREPARRPAPKTPAKAPAAEPAAEPEPAAAPAAEQRTEYLAREPQPSVFAAVEQDTEILRVEPATAKAAEPAAAEPAAPAAKATAPAVEQPAAPAAKATEPEPAPAAPAAKATEPAPAAPAEEPAATEAPAAKAAGSAPAAPAPAAPASAAPASAEPAAKAGEPVPPAAPEEPSAKATEPAAPAPATPEPAAEAADPAPAAPEAEQPAAPAAGSAAPPAAAPVAPAAEKPVAPVADPEPTTGARPAEPVAAEPADPAGQQPAPASAPAAESAATTAQPASAPAESTAAAGAPAPATGPAAATGNPDDEPDDEDRPATRDERVGVEPRDR
jgi:prolipoprotein diacylglyceryl transferase